MVMLVGGCFGICVAKWVHGYVGRRVGMLLSGCMGICVGKWVHGYVSRWLGGWLV